MLFVSDSEDTVGLAGKHAHRNAFDIALMPAVIIQDTTEVTARTQGVDGLATLIRVQEEIVDIDVRVVELHRDIHRRADPPIHRDRAGSDSG